MTKVIARELLPKVGKLLEEQLGLYFSAERYSEMEKKVREALRDFGYQDWEEGIKWLLSAKLNSKEIETLAKALTIGETYFFREKNTLKALEDHVLPELINQRRGKTQTLRIWSAGCSTGEEPYSLAILLKKLLGDIDNWNIKIYASDINPLALEKAAQGIYNEWSFRDTPQWVRKGYFKQLNNQRWEINSEIKDIVCFSYLNLAQDVFPQTIDILLCRNVLIYFSEEGRNKVLTRMYHSLADGGWFVTSSLEHAFVNPEFYTFKNFTNAILYKKYPHSKLKNVTLDQSPIPLAKNKDYIIKQAPPWKMQCKSKDKEQAKKDPKDSKIMDPTLLEMKARELANKGQLTQAQELCLQALAVDKLNPLLYFLLATIRQEAGKNEEAADALKKALFLDPQFILAHFTLGYLAQQAHDHQEAARHLQNALKAAETYAKTDLVPASDGLSVGKLIESIITMTEGGIKP